MRATRIALFEEYGRKYKTHGYRWLNAKIRLDIKDFNCSDGTVYEICKFLGIKSKSKHERQKYRTLRKDGKNYQNLTLNKIAPNEPFKVVVSDMTVMKHRGQYHEVTWYMDLFNNELISYGVSDKKGDPNIYYDGLYDLINKKQEYNNFTTILHTDGGSVYRSENYNLLLDKNLFIHSMTASGTPTENGAMESINGWVKEELIRECKLDDGDTIEEAIERYIYYFNNERPAATLHYLIPIQYKQKYFIDKNNL